MSDMQEFDARFGNGNGSAPALPRPPAGQATQVEQARVIAEVRAAVMIAMDQPRDRTAAMVEMRETCGILGLAERAFFRVQRGNQHVNGESIHLARELARIWGNITYGCKELARDDIRGQSELLAYAWDLQTNARSEITFVVPHRRDTRNGARALTGTQEIYENNASFAGRRLREAIFAVLPVWFKAEAAEICHETLKNGGGKPLVQRIADLRTAFEDLGVTAAQLERKRGRRVGDFLPEDVGALRVVYGSLKRGEVTVAEEFPAGDAIVAGDKLAVIEHAATEAQGSPPAQAGAALPQSSPPEPEQPHSAPRGAAADAVAERDDLAVPLSANPSVAAMDYWVRQLRALIAEAPLTPERAAGIRTANAEALEKLRLELPAVYADVQRALTDSADTEKPAGENPAG